MGTSIKIVGLDKLNRKLRKNATLNDVKTVVSTNGSRLEREIKANTKEAYVKGYSEQNTADSVNGNPLDGSMSYEAGIAMSYNPYTEFGTRFMEPEPVVKPAIESVGAQFERDMRRLTE
jgi:HK97 gp10 family phage protein